jgi:hypothetical protein
MKPSSGRTRRASLQRALAPVLLGVCLWAPIAGRAADSACAYLTRAISVQPGAAVLLASYPTAEPGPLQHAAFLYDNAVAAIALIACGQAAQARRIGDALLWALEHDRHWHDGRLRNAYPAGTVNESPLKLTGWWDAHSSRWLEDSYQTGSDAGNLAWAMLALLSLDADSRARADPGGDRRYLRAAERLAQWLVTLRDTRGAGGFIGGSFGSEPAPQRLLWKSTEHNIDLAAAFGRLADANGEARWRSQAQAAAHFVALMWEPDGGSFATGTTADGVTRNTLQALDAQIWPLLALPGAVTAYSQVLPHAVQRLRAGQGYAYSQAGGGVWTEGTAQVLLLFKLMHREALGSAPESAIAAARTPNGGYFATATAALPTGFMLDTDPTKPREYLHLEHLGAAAWVALAEQGFNPFTAARSLPP